MRPGRLAVEFYGDFGPEMRHLDMVSVGKLVSALGTITGLHQTGSDVNPRVMVTLTGESGESAQCVVDSEHYLDLWDRLVEGTQVTVSGKVRRPLTTEPAFIDTLSVVAGDARLEDTGADVVRQVVEQFTLSYVQDGQPCTREPLPRWRVESVGRVLMSVADRGTVSDIKVVDQAGTDVTFEFACFVTEQASGTASASEKAVSA
ncbi:OB-fold nucleic acid binding domain-containing protein [Streptomyces lasiicapitis]|uniref:OB-fold nucleic acid binding domain-containing protein n=1 Tax=Streptomyces lasiicapitis TaxID=1923961 RepID=UPI003323AC19